MSTSSAPRRVLLNVGAPLLALAALVGAILIPAKKTEAKTEAAARVVRVGYLPNLTHAQAIAGAERGDFVRALEGVKVEFRTFNAGPALIEAIFAGEIDIAYVGPSPAVNAYAKSGGEEIRIIAGSAANGASVVVRPGVDSLDGRKVATPQFGNTQDVAARTYLGTKATIVNAENADILTLLKKGDVDAAWVPEPWASRLVAEAGARILFEEKTLWPGRKFTTTTVIARRAFLDANRDIVKRFLGAHEALTAWVNANPDEARRLVNEGLKRLTGKALAPDVLRQAWDRVVFTTDPLADTTREQARRAQALGFTKSLPDLGRLFVEDLR